jgi:hypothetical protein
MNIRIREKDTGHEIGRISEADLKILLDHMEEESTKDVDYFVDPTAVDALERLGASAELVTLLRNAIAGSEGVDIVWERT